MTENEFAKLGIDPIAAHTGAQVHQESLLEAVQAVTTGWFDGVRPLLETASFSPSIVAQGSDIFERLLRQAKRRSSKNVLLSLRVESVNVYKDIIHNIEISSFASSGSLSIAPYIEGSASDEGEYLDEAQRCLTLNCKREAMLTDGDLMVTWKVFLDNSAPSFGDIDLAPLIQAAREARAADR